MNEKTKAYIKEYALSIQNYWNLHPDDQKWIFPLLHSSIISAIALREAIADRPRNYAEIAAITELSENTVKQITYALADVGIQVFSEGRAYYPLGRPRKFKKLKNSNQ
jgi:biotin operon repressor